MATTFQRFHHQWLPEVNLGEVLPLDLTYPQLHLLRRKLENQPNLWPPSIQELSQPLAFRPSPPLGAFRLPPGPLMGAPPTYPPLDLPHLRQFLAHRAVGTNGLLQARTRRLSGYLPECSVTRRETRAIRAR